MRLRHAVSIVMTTGLIVTGCSTRESDPVLATVGTEKITLATLREAYQVLPEKPDLTNPEKKRSLLQDLINKQLMELEARRLAPDLDDSQRRRLHRFAESQLLQLLQKTEVSDKATVTDDELKEIWNRMDKEIKARHILARTQGDLQDILGELKQGKSFEDVAKEKSFDSKSGEEGGDLGWVSAGQMVEPFDHALFKMSKGQVSEPVKSRFGWHVIRVDDIRPAERPSFDAVKEKIRLNLLQQRSATATEAFNASLNDKAKPENQFAAIDLIDKKFTFEVPLDKASDPYANLNTPRNIPSFTPEELAMPVVKFADRPDFTIKDFNEALGWMPPGVWPKGGGADEVEDLIRQMLRTKLYKERALELGLEKSPEYVTVVKKKENEMRVNTLYYNGIVSQIQPTDSDLRDFFEKHRDNYKVLERSSQARVETADSTVAAMAAALWRAGKSFDEVEAAVRKVDTGALMTAKSPDLPHGGEPALDTLVYAARIKDIVGPVYLRNVKDPNGVPLPSRWVVAQVLEVKPERFMTFDEAKTYVTAHAKSSMADERLKKLLADLEKRFTVTVNEKELATVTPEMMTPPAPRSAT